MTTAQMPPKNYMILAVLGIGAFWMMTRKANAVTLNPGAVNNAASKTFFVSPATASLQQPGVSPTRVQGNMLTAAIDALLNPALVRTPGYVPSYTPDTTGEAAAQAYAANNPDAFVANPPSLYQQQQWLAAGAAEGATGGN